MRAITGVLAFVLIGSVLTCGSASADSGPVDAVSWHILVSKAGDVDALRDGACGDLAAAMDQHSDDEVREEFIDAYELGPDQLEVVQEQSTDAQKLVVGFYENVMDLDISFVVEDHDGWKVCEINRGNGMFGPLPGPFES